MKEEKTKLDVNQKEVNLWKSRIQKVFSLMEREGVKCRKNGTPKHRVGIDAKKAYLKNGTVSVGSKGAASDSLIRAVYDLYAAGQCIVTLANYTVINPQNPEDLKEVYCEWKDNHNLSIYIQPPHTKTYGGTRSSNLRNIDNIEVDDYDNEDNEDNNDSSDDNSDDNNNDNNDNNDNKKSSSKKKKKKKKK